MNECLRNHRVRRGDDMVSTIMCAHLDGQSAAVYAASYSPSGYNAVYWWDGKTGSITSPIPEPLKEHFEQWCEVHLRGKVAQS